MFREIIGNLKRSSGASNVAPAGTLQVDVTTGKVYIHNGVTPGGSPLSISTGIIPNGTTASRPASPVRGQTYFDTTIGTAIWYNGTTWVNALGAPV